jgi:GDP-mannose pyrophosphatase NudK
MKDLRAKITKINTLSHQKDALKKVTYDLEGQDGKMHSQSRSIFDRGNAACILLYNKTQRTIILTRQFRMPTFLNENKTGMLIEACAGMLDGEKPQDCIRRETLEETGFKIRKVKRLFKAYMSPGSTTELIHFFVAEYDDSMKISQGGGLIEENENIQIIEIPFKQALGLMNRGKIMDAKTIMLLQYVELNRLIDSDH